MLFSHGITGTPGQCEQLHHGGSTHAACLMANGVERELLVTCMVEIIPVSGVLSTPLTGA